MTIIAGVKIPSDKNILYALTSIYGIGIQTSKKILDELGIQKQLKVKELTEEQVSIIFQEVKKYLVEGALRMEVSLNIKRLKEIGSDRGAHHHRGLPVRGQKTRNNAKTAKKKRKKIVSKTNKKNSNVNKNLKKGR